MIDRDSWGHRYLIVRGEERKEYAPLKALYIYIYTKKSSISYFCLGEHTTNKLQAPILTKGLPTNNRGGRQRTVGGEVACGGGGGREVGVGGSFFLPPRSLSLSPRWGMQLTD